jgi:hypothetical protein
MVWHTARETEAYNRGVLDDADAIDPQEANMYGDEIPDDGNWTPINR